MILSVLACGSVAWGVEIDSLQGISGGKDYLFEISTGDSLRRERSEFEKLVEGDNLAQDISDSIPIEDEDKKLAIFRQRLGVEVDSFLQQEARTQRVPLFLYKENNHYYSPSPVRQEFQYEELTIHPFLLRSYQLYQDYSPFWAESEKQGSVYFSRVKYDMPVLLTKALLAQGYNGSDLDQAIVNIYKSQVYDCLDFQLGFNGSSGKWLSEQTKEKSKDLYGSVRYYWDDYFSLDYSFLYFDHDLPSEKLFFSQLNTTTEYDSLLDLEHISYKSQQHFFVLRSVVFDAGYSYSREEYLLDSLLQLDKKYSNESYFYALDLDFWGQNLAVGRKSYNNYEATKIDERLYYKGKLQTQLWHGASISGYHDQVNTSFSAQKGLPWGFSVFGDYTDKQNQALDTALLINSNIIFQRVESYTSSFCGVAFANKVLSGRVSAGNLQLEIAEYSVLADTTLIKQKGNYDNDVLQADVKVRLPFSLWGQKMALGYQVEARRYLSGDTPYIYPEVQMRQNYEMIFYFNYGNVLTLGWRNYNASDYFASFADKNNSKAVSSNEMLDYYLKLDLTNKFSVLMDIKNYDKDEEHLGTTPYRRHFKMNFVWYLFD